MRKKIAITLVLYLLLILFLPGCTARKMPAILIDGAVYKFGEVIEGEEVVFTFFFTNPGNKELIIKELFVSCFCVNVKTYDKVVQPGEKGKVYGVIKTTGFLGKISKAIRMETNIPGSSPTLVIEGEILPR